MTLLRAKAPPASAAADRAATTGFSAINLAKAAPAAINEGMAAAAAPTNPATNPPNPVPNNKTAATNAGHQVPMNLTKEPIFF